MEKKKYIIDKFQELDLNISLEQAQQFLDYYNLLYEWNQKMNLTAITGFEDVVEKHFIDSLCLVKEFDPEKYNTFIDVGTGAGFPGIPIKIIFPHLRVTLLDSLNKRIKFLNEVVDRLQFDSIEVIHGRAEEAAKNKEYREKFDFSVSRAVADLSVLTEYCIPFIREGGKFISYKSGNVESELDGAAKAISVLGGRIEKKAEFLLPGSDISRSLIIIEKVKNTPNKYPRKPGTVKKEPIK